MTDYNFYKDYFKTIQVIDRRMDDFMTMFHEMREKISILESDIRVFKEGKK